MMGFIIDTINQLFARRSFELSEDQLKQMEAMFSLPMLADVTKKRSDGRNLRCFFIACLFVLIYGYNRIHMTNHFLSDVCFGTLITYLIYAVVSKAFLNAAEKE